jgi:TRAP-type C4-dicarboxylate transport system permease small subunit
MAGSEGSDGYFTRFLRFLALVAGWILLALTIYTVLDVVLRYGFNAPFRGSLETTQFALVLIVFLGLAYCGATGGHIAVDLLEKLLDRPSLRLLPALIAVLGAALMAMVAWQTAVEAYETMHRVSNMIRWPYYPFRFAAAFGSAAFAAVLLTQAIQSFRRTH